MSIQELKMVQVTGLAGEQYSVLSKHKGILLAENHYLPVDKRGNVNVLVVGRIWFSENLLHTLSQMHISF